VASAVQCQQSRHGKIGRSHEDDAHSRKEPFDLSLSKRRPYFRAGKKKGQGFDRPIPNG
jgi:hypothetical protein